MALACTACRHAAIGALPTGEIDLAGLERRLEEMRPGP
jgi:hypothetical protein